MTPRPLYIILDGIDYCGKSTQVRLLESYLKSIGHRVVCLKEPDREGEYGKRIYEILETENDIYKSAELCFDLYLKDRKVNTEKRVIPKLNEGISVIQDRGKYATRCYQAAQGINENRIIEAHKGLLLPDLVVIMQITVEESMRRRESAGRNITADMFEKKREFLEKVAKNYGGLRCDWEDENILYADGMQSVEDVHSQIKTYVGLIH